ncbi:MAG: selenide, water dikinase SelD [Candidatus Eisenbacteria bacterium]|nr:selenide, water dikinase SelD [Candidatus Eisenbacteria bacterium]
MGPEDLASVLAKLPPVDDPRVLVGTSTADDAGVYLLDEDRGLVFTTDFFTPIVDDARDFGRIAAANALSDVYAMGGKPLIALNLMCFPDGEIPFDIMAEIIAGGQEKLGEAGALPLGGHSVSDRELKYGLAVVGTVDPGRIVTNAGARPGDTLVLTKPIGTGVMTTALKNEALETPALARVTELMLRLNRDASEAMLDAGAHAATDITGFGLAGHALEMAQASEVTLEIDVASVPLIEGALEAARNGHVPGGLFTNHHYVKPRTTITSRAESFRLQLMYDPQTSGGLLTALEPDAVEGFLAAVSERGHDEAREIGRVIETGDRPLRLV